MESVRARGYSLIETIIASFVLVAAFFVVSRLFHTGLQYASKMESRVEAVQIAEQRMAELRRWAKEAHTWNGFPNAETNPNYPRYLIATSLEERSLFAPSTELERAWPDDNRREMTNVARLATVVVKWGGRGRYSMTALITRGTPSWRDSVPENRARDEIVIEGSIPASVGPNQEVRLTAVGYDENDRKIPGLFFHWSVEPVYGGGNPGIGRVQLVRRDGTEVIFTNQVRRRDLMNQPWTPSNGQCRVTCYAVYNGVQRICETEEINLTGGGGP